jgi:hypothetical protein
MTLKPIEHDTLLRVKNSLAFTNTAYLDEAMLNNVLELWNDYSNVDPDPELLQIKRLIFYATLYAKPSNNDYRIEFSNSDRGTIMKKLLNIDLRYIKEQDELERKLLKVGEKHKMVEVVIDDEVNFKMQISKGDKLTLEITDKGVIQVSLSEDKKEK